MTTRPATDSSVARADQLARALHAGLPVSERRLDLAGVSTCLLEGGQGPPVVLLHGLGMFAEMWAGVIPHLWPAIGSSCPTCPATDDPGCQPAPGWTLPRWSPGSGS
jgi:pimeloyl-ACP methyl ester carboxylesterase